MAKYINTDLLEVVAFTDRQGSFSDGVQWLLEYIDALPSADVQSVQRWIPCNKKLPENSRILLVTDWGETCVGRRYDGRWWDCDGNVLKDVSAWMDLPKPYEDGEQE